MKTLLFPLLAFVLDACVATPPATPVARGSIARSDTATPELSVLHVSGRISRVPSHSQWPASVKVGARFDY